MKCEQFEEYFRKNAQDRDEEKVQILDHLKSCKSCREKYNPISGLVVESVSTNKPNPKTTFTTDAFWIFFVPAVIGILGLAIFLIFVR